MVYMFLRDKVVKKTRRSWKCSKNEKGCTARIHTPLEYDDPDVADDLHLDLTVFVISDYHTCQPDPSIYYKKKLMRRCKALGKEEPHKYGRSIVTSCMSTACKEVNLPPEMSKDTLICNYGPLISQEKYFNPPKNHYLN